MLPFVTVGLYGALNGPSCLEPLSVNGLVAIIWHCMSHTKAIQYLQVFKPNIATENVACPFSHVHVCVSINLIEPITLSKCVYMLFCPAPLEHHCVNLDNICTTGVENPSCPYYILI